MRLPSLRLRDQHREPGPVGEVLIDESLVLSEMLSFPVTVRRVDGEMWAYPAETSTRGSL